MLTAWYEHFGERIVTIKEVISAATANVVSLRDAIEMAVPADKGGVFSSLKLAKFIGRFVRRIEGGLRFERAADDSHHKVARWSVKRVEFAGDAGVCGCSSSPYAREQKTDESTFSKNDSRTGWENPRKHPQPPQDPPSNEAVFAALAAAAKAGAAFRLSGNRVEISGLEKVEQAEPAVAAFLREHDRAVFAALGGGAADQPSIALIETLGVEIAYCADDSTAAAAIVEVLADAGDRPIAIDVETAALPEYADYPPIRLTIAGRPNKVQPRSDNHAALDPHLSEIRLVQLYGGGQRVAVLDMRSCKGQQEKAEQGIWPTKRPLGYRNVAGPDGKKIIAADPDGRADDRRSCSSGTRRGHISLKEAARKARDAGLVYPQERRQGAGEHRPLDPAQPALHRPVRMERQAHTRAGTSRWSQSTCGNVCRACSTAASPRSTAA